MKTRPPLPKRILNTRKRDLKRKGPTDVVRKSDVTEAIYYGHCPIIAGRPFRDEERPPKRFTHSMTEAELRGLLSLARRQPRSFLEIGSYWGDTAILVAGTYDIPVVCIDTWLGGLPVWKGDASAFLLRGVSDDSVPGEIPPASSFFRQFASNIDAAGVADRVTAIRLPSTSGLRLLAQAGLRFDAIYVDASHDFVDAYLDIVQSSVLLTPGGIMFGDDFHIPGVRNAVTDACAHHGWTFQSIPRADEERGYWAIPSPQI